MWQDTSPKRHMISIHALREEGDVFRAMAAYVKTDFYPRPPRGGRPEILAQMSEEFSISIHALREEGDQSTACDSIRHGLISIHALREEGDHGCCCPESRCR